MVKLDYDFKIGKKVEIPQNLSWQANEKGIGGTYEIEKIFDDDDIVLLKKSKAQFGEASRILVERRCLAYFNGKEFQIGRPYEPYNPDEYLPALREKNYATEDDGENAEFGFWYVAMRCGMPKYPLLESEMLDDTWCYYIPHPFPWMD